MKAAHSVISFRKHPKHRNCLSTEFIKKIPHLITIKDYIKQNKASIKQISHNRSSIKTIVDVSPHLLLTRSKLVKKASHNKQELTTTTFSMKDKEGIQTEIDSIVKRLTDITSQESTNYQMTNYRPSSRKFYSKETIYPKSRISELLDQDPCDKAIKKSFNIQLSAFGEEKYRKAFLEGVNQYKRDNVRYRPVSLSPSHCEETALNRIISAELNMNKAKLLNFQFKGYPMKRANRLLPVIKASKSNKKDEDEKKRVHYMQTFDTRVDETLFQSTDLIKTINRNSAYMKSQKELLSKFNTLS